MSFLCHFLIFWEKGERNEIFKVDEAAVSSEDAGYSSGAFAVCHGFLVNFFHEILFTENEMNFLSFSPLMTFEFSKLREKTTHFKDHFYVVI